MSWGSSCFICIGFFIVSSATSLGHLFPPSLKLHQKRRRFSFPGPAVTECRCSQLVFFGGLKLLLQFLSVFLRTCGGVFCYQLGEYRLKLHVDIYKFLVFICHRRLRRICATEGMDGQDVLCIQGHLHQITSYTVKVTLIFFVSVHSEVLCVTVVEKLRRKRNWENKSVFFSQQIWNEPVSLSFLSF